MTALSGVGLWKSLADTLDLTTRTRPWPFWDKTHGHLFAKTAEKPDHKSNPTKKTETTKQTFSGVV
jgi:hypothetical protein